MPTPERTCSSSAAAPPRGTGRRRRCACPPSPRARRSNLKPCGRRTSSRMPAPVASSVGVLALGVRAPQRLHQAVDPPAQVVAGRRGTRPGAGLVAARHEARVLDRPVHEVARAGPGRAVGAAESQTVTTRSNVLSRGTPRRDFEWAPVHARSRAPRWPGSREGWTNPAAAIPPRRDRAGRGSRSARAPRPSGCARRFRCRGRGSVFLASVMRHAPGIPPIRFCHERVAARRA